MDARHLLPLLAALMVAAPATAQEAADRFAAAAEAPSLEGARDLTATGVAKWMTLAASVASAGWGLWAHARADERYAELEARCLENAGRCSARNADGSFADPALEAEYQDILHLDRNTRWALVTSQVGVLASVALFILDIGEDEGPTIIPYEPRALEVGPAPGGGMALTVRVATGSVGR